MYDLSICCVSRGDEKSLPFLEKMNNWCIENNSEFFLAIDGGEIPKFCSSAVLVKSKGYIESVLDSVVERCGGRYVFRLDDDEFFSDELSRWLQENKSSLDGDVYSFPRMNLWQDEDNYIPGIYPDVQIRLTKREKAGGRNVIHNLSPFGFGTRIDFPILHYKFLVRDYSERRRIAEVYESIMPGAGTGKEYIKYNLPEDYYTSIGVKKFHEKIK